MSVSWKTKAVWIIIESGRLGENLVCGYEHKSQAETHVDSLNSRQMMYANEHERKTYKIVSCGIRTEKFI